MSDCKKDTDKKALICTHILANYSSVTYLLSCSVCRDVKKLITNEKGQRGEGLYLNLGGGGVKAGTIFLQQTNGPLTRGCTLCLCTLKRTLVMTFATDKFHLIFLFTELSLFFNTLKKQQRYFLYMITAVSSCRLFDS